VLVIASIGWVLVTAALWAVSVWLIESDDMDESVRRDRRGGEW